VVLFERCYVWNPRNLRWIVFVRQAEGSPHDRKFSVDRRVGGASAPAHYDVCFHPIGAKLGGAEWSEVGQYMFLRAQLENWQILTIVVGVIPLDVGHQFGDRDSFER